MIKTNKQKPISLKQIFVAKGRKIPADVLDGVEPTQSLDTSWSIEINGDTVNYDEVPTTFTGKWIPPANELSNMVVGGAIHINAEYDYAFPVDVVEFHNIGQHDDDPNLSSVTSALREKLLGFNDKNFIELRNEVDPFIVSTLTLHSTVALSDVMPGNVVNSFTYSKYAFYPVSGDVSKLILVGDFSEIKSDRKLLSANSDVISAMCLSANDILDVANWNFDLSAYPTYRMILHPKCEKAVTLTFRLSGANDSNILGGFSKQSYYRPEIENKKFGFSIINLKDGVLSNAIVVKGENTINVVDFDVTLPAFIEFEKFNDFFSNDLGMMANDEPAFAVYNPTCPCILYDSENNRRKPDCLIGFPMYRTTLLSCQINGETRSWNEILGTRFTEDTVIDVPAGEFCGANIELRYILVDNKLQNASEFKPLESRLFGNEFLVLNDKYYPEYYFGNGYSAYDAGEISHGITFTNGVNDSGLDIKTLVETRLSNGDWNYKLTNCYSDLIDQEDAPYVVSGTPKQLIASTDMNTIIDVEEMLQDQSFSNKEILKSVFENEETITLYLVFTRN